MFKISSSKGEEITLSPDQLIKDLIAKAYLSEGNEKLIPIDSLSNSLFNSLKNDEIVDNITFKQLISLSLTVGYYYRVFLNNNNVNITVDSVKDK